MPDKSEQLRRAAEDLQFGPRVRNTGGYTPNFTGPPPEIDFGEGYQERAQSLEETPNYDKLTRGERWVMDKLPGFAESKAGEVLQKFNDGPFGKALQWLDVGAEAIERGTGFAAQWKFASQSPEEFKDFRDNLTEAWYAGSLIADTTNYPKFIDGRYYVPTDLPGIEGVVAARRRLVAGDDLETVRNDYLNSLGALAIRAQLNDAMFHIAGDPLNAVLPMLKPVERINSLRIRKIMSALPEDLGARVDELNAIIKTTKKAKNLEAMAAAETELNALSNMAELSWAEQKFLQFTGGIPGLDKPIEKMSLAERIWRKGPLALTPQARAHEYSYNVIRNIEDYVIATGTDPQDIANIIRSAADGVRDPRIAAMLVRPEGRAVKGVLGEMAAHTDQLAKAVSDVAVERNVSGFIAEVLGEDVTSLVSRMADEPAAIFEQFMRKVDEVPEVREALDLLLQRTGIAPEQFSAELLEAIPGMLDGIPYTKELFGVVLKNIAADIVARQGVMRFGVKARGLLENIADNMKKVESLAFLRMNPSYPIKNFINNTFTTIGRGNYGIISISADDVADFTKLAGISPDRFFRGFGAAGLGELADEGSSALGKAEKIIGEAVEGKTGLVGRGIDQFTEAAKKKLGKFDMGNVAARAEAMASARASVYGYWRGWSQFWKPGASYKSMADFSSELSVRVGDDVVGAVERAIASARNEGELRKVVFAADNINLNSANIVSRTEKALGRKVDTILPPEVLQTIGDDLVAAAKKGPQAIQDTIASTRNKVIEHIEKSLDDALDVVVDETAALVEGEGPGAFTTLWARIVDDVQGANTRHALDMSELDFNALRGLPIEVRNSRWRAILENSESYYERFWRRQQARMDGMSQAAKKVDIQGSDDITNSFRELRKSWKGFFRKRNKRWGDFHDALVAGDDIPLGEAKKITEELDVAYQSAIDLESKLTKDTDNLLSQLLPEEQRPLFQTTRERVVLLRDRDKQMVVDFRNELKSVPRGDWEAAYQNHWQRRMSLWNEINKTERAGLTAMQGNDEAARLFGTLDEPSEAAARAAEDVTDIGRETLPDFHEIVSEEPYFALGMDDLWYTRADETLRALGNSAAEINKEAPLRFGNLNDDLQTGIRRYVEHAERSMADARNASVKFAEYSRDSALLNYNRRFNYNTWLGTIAPYEFWMTQSMFKWALHSIDRPAMLSTFLRTKKFIDTGFRPESGFPTRLRGHLRINTPFLPKWFGDWIGDQVFVNPMRAVIPVDQFLGPIEERAADERRMEGRVERVLEELRNDGKIGELEYETALLNRSGPDWDRALSLAQLDDTEKRTNFFDFASTLVSPHAPVMWAYLKSQGREDEIGPFLPITRSIKGITGMMGINAGRGLNPEGAIREALGLPAFDKWEDYRVDRMLSNMVADGDISLDEASRAMLERAGPTFELAQRRAGKEFGIQALGSTIGIPAKAYPTGEEHLRNLTDEYQTAWARYEDGDRDALRGFFEENPEYESRLGLFDSPEQRLNKFLVDHIWDSYNDLPTIDRNEARLALGDDFVNSFLDKETRSTDGLPPDLLGVWLKMLKGDPPLGLGKDAIAINFAPPEVARQAQFFYDYRKLNFPNYFDLQDDYFKLKKGSARRGYIQNHPELGEYWDWRRDFLQRNPTAASYIDDDFEPNFASEKELRDAFAGEPNISAEELAASLGQETTNLIQDFVRDGNPVPEVVLRKLEEMGLDLETVANMLR